MIVFDHIVDTQIHPYETIMCTFLPQRYALCITSPKQTHALQIVATQNMTLHCSLYAIQFLEIPIT